MDANNLFNLEQTAAELVETEGFLSACSEAYHDFNHRLRNLTPETLEAEKIFLQPR